MRLLTASGGWTERLVGLMAKKASRPWLVFQAAVRDFVDPDELPGGLLGFHIFFSAHFFSLLSVDELHSPQA